MALGTSVGHYPDQCFVSTRNIDQDDITRGTLLIWIAYREHGQDINFSLVVNFDQRLTSLTLTLIRTMRRPLKAHL